MTRSFGDLVASSVGVIYTPDVTTTVLTEDHKTIIVASDGLWEFVPNEAIISKMCNYKENHTLEEICQEMITLATRAWKKEDEIVDDITLVMVELSSAY